MSGWKTIRDALAEGTRVLEQAGIDNASYDAGELLGFVVGKAYGELAMFGDSPFSPENAERYRAMLHKRCEHYPLQYILREWDFYNLSFSVGEGVLIPRPETELLVDIALSYLKTFYRDSCPATVLDLCSGSGCVGITVERNFPNCRVIAVEKSKEATEIIRTNIVRNGTERFTLLEGDLLDGPAHFGIRNADLILANPPYLTKEEMGHLQEELTFEPPMALYGGEDGLLFYHAIAELWTPILSGNGVIAVEIGEQQANDVSEIFRSFSDHIKVFRDCAGHLRTVVAGPSFSLTI